MPNRWTLKDLVFLLLLGALGVSVWLKMVQDDRLWRKVAAVEVRLAEIERRLGEVGRTPPPVPPTPASTPANASEPAPAEPRDTSWAKPGVDILWQPPLTLHHDPRAAPNFRTGGELIELGEASPRRLTPFLASDTVARRVIDLVCQTLAESDLETLALRGVLAQAWQIDPAGLWLRVLLRPEARFSDGSPLTSADLVYSVKNLWLDPEIESPDGRKLARRIADCTALSPLAAEFTFTSPSAFNEATALGCYVLPKAFFERFDPAQLRTSTGLLVGSGPFKLAELIPERQWTEGQPIVLVRNDSAWGPQPPLERVRLQIMKDDVARLTAFRNGEADLMSPSPAQVEALRKDPQALGGDGTGGAAGPARLLEWVNVRSSYQSIAWQCGVRKGGRATPFADPRVRQAMTMLLDREGRILRDIYAGSGQIAKGPFSPLSKASNPDLRPLPFDMDRAKALLAEAGWQDRDADGVLDNPAGEPFEFQLTRPVGGETEQRLASYIVDQCAKAGIRCAVRELASTPLQTAFEQSDFDAIRLAWSGPGPDPDPAAFWHSRSIGPGGRNGAQWRSPAADALIDAAEKELDRDKRFALLRELEGVIAAEQPYTFIRIMPWTRAIRPEILNLHAYPGGLALEEAFRAADRPK